MDSSVVASHLLSQDRLNWVIRKRTLALVEEVLDLLLVLRARSKSPSLSSPRFQQLL